MLPLAKVWGGRQPELQPGESKVDQEAFLLKKKFRFEEIKIGPP